MALIKLIESILCKRLDIGAKKKESLEESIAKISSIVGTIQESQMILLRDRLRYLAHKYLTQGYISFVERGDISDMRDFYKKFGGNGNLLPLLDRVLELPIR